MPEGAGKSINFELSNSYYQEGTLDVASWFRVAVTDYNELLGAFDFEALFSRYDMPIELLDVGCGTGKFPSMLRDRLPQGMEILYDYLDPSQHSLKEMQKVLSGPFRARKAFETTLEDLRRSDCPSNGYNIVWCIQSLYCLPHSAVIKAANTLSKIINSENGAVLIFLASRDAFYHQMYNLYNKVIRGPDSQSYVTAEDLVTAIESLHIPYESATLDFHHSVPRREPDLLEKYLQQCVLDRRPLAEWSRNRALVEFLDSFSNAASYEFPQKLSLIIFCSTSRQTKELMQQCWLR